jgi:flagellin-like protein
MVRFSRRGLSPVISSVILCAAVITVGIGVWSIAHSVTTLTRDRYYREVAEAVEKIKERFCIENMNFTRAQNMLTVWVFNYGDIDITISQIVIRGGGNEYRQEVNRKVASGALARIDVAPTGIQLSDIFLSIEVRTTRGNKAYASFYI